MKKRLFDIILGIALLPILIPLMLCIALLIKLTSHGGVIYWSQRSGRNGVIFYMPKFRSMKIGSPVLSDARAAQLNFFGNAFRTSGLDELPQLFSILKGDMSFVGPRPIIPQESELIALRKQKKIDRILPGLTGWAQINGRNQLTNAQKVGFDWEYMNKQSLWFDMKILVRTVIQIVRQEKLRN